MMKKIHDQLAQEKIKCKIVPRNLRLLLRI